MCAENCTFSCMPRPALTIRATRGSRLAALRRAFGVGQILIAKLAGIPRSELSQLETDKLQWKSETDWQGLCRAFGLERGLLERYLDGLVPLSDLVPIAATTVERGKREHQGTRDAKALARSALHEAGLARDELAELILIFLQRYLARDPHVSRAHLIDRAFVARDRLRVAERPLREPESHQSVADRVRSRR